MKSCLIEVFDFNNNQYIFLLIILIFVFLNMSYSILNDLEIISRPTSIEMSAQTVVNAKTNPN